MAEPSLPVDPRLLRPLLVLAEELHFTRAAQRLHTTQSALSQQIARLELQVGTRLFDRPPLAVALTPAGEALVAGARPALAAFDRAVDDARAAAGSVPSELTLGHVSSLALHVAPALVAAFARLHPGTALRPSDLNIEEQLAALPAGQIDAALFAAGPDLDRAELGLHVEPVAHTPQFVAIPAGHPVTTRLSPAAVGHPRVRLTDLAGEPWILPIGTMDATGAPQATMFQTLCERHGFAPRIAHQADSIDGLLGLTTAGLGLSAVPWVVTLRRPAGVVLAEIEGESVDTLLVTAKPPSGLLATLAGVARDVFMALGAPRRPGGGNARGASAVVDYRP